MLVLSRQKDESIIIADKIEVIVIDIRNNKVRLGIRASRDIPVHRKELLRSRKQNHKLNKDIKDN
jgi:carbon storage regulator